jgi:acyl carrier protein
MTTSLEDQLLQAFRAVFPSQTDEELRAGSPDTLERWDSTKHFVLIEVIEEMFGVRISERDAGELLSFAAFESYLSSRTSQ